MQVTIKEHSHWLITTFNAVFIICHSVKWIPNLYELLYSNHEEGQFSWPEWIRKLTLQWLCISILSGVELTSIVSSFLITLNGSFNVFIYIFKHHKLVIGLFLPNTKEIPLHRNPSRSISFCHYQYSQESMRVSSSRRRFLQLPGSSRKDNVSYAEYQETAV